MTQYCLQILTLIQSRRAKISRITRLSTPLSFMRQNSKPSRVTPNTETCLDHLSTSFSVKNETIKTTFNDHYTANGEIHIDTKSSQEKQQNVSKTRNLKNIKGDKVVNFLFLLDQKQMKLEEENLTFDIICNTILDCVDRFPSDIKNRRGTIG